MLQRPSLDDYYLALLPLIASRATCPRRRVAAILVDAGGKLVAIGYNGVPSKMPHCIDTPCPGAIDQPGDTTRCIAIHAEMNALSQARASRRLPHTLYCSTTPCFDCAKLLVTEGVKRVVARGEYADRRGVDLLGQAGINVEIITTREEEAVSYPHLSTECQEHHDLVRDFHNVAGMRPTIICLCGSTRFRDQFAQANYRETLAGNIVLSVGFYVHIADECPNCDASQSFAEEQGAKGQQGKCWQCGADLGCTPKQKIALDKLHKWKIDLCDEVFVLNVGGYVGDSTRSEIAYAVARGKPVRYLEVVNTADGVKEKEVE